MPILALHGFTGRGSDFAPFAEVFSASRSAQVSSGRIRQLPEKTHYPAIHPASKIHPSPTPGIKPVATNTVASGFTPARPELVEGRSDPNRKSTRSDSQHKASRDKPQRDSLPDWQCPDLPGHGPDPQLDCSPDATLRFVNETAATVCTEQATSPRVLLAYSMGARAGLLHAVNYPDYWDALVLVSGNPGIEDPAVRTDRVKADEALAQSLERMGVAGFLDFWQETPLIRGQKHIPGAWRETMLQNRQHHTVGGLASSLRQFGQGSCPNLWPRVGDLAMPVCLITGAKDTKYTKIAKRMAERLPHPKSRHAIIEAASHMPHLEQAEVTGKVVTSFLARL